MCRNSVERRLETRRLPICRQSEAAILREAPENGPLIRQIAHTIAERRFRERPGRPTGAPFNSSAHSRRLSQRTVEEGAVYNATMRTRSALVLALFLLGCKDKSPGGAPASGGTAPPSPPAASVAKNPCSLLTADEINAVVGNPVKPVERDNTYCRYTNEDPDKYEVALNYMHNDPLRTCAVLLPKIPGNPAGRVEPVTGLGEKAGWEWNPAGSDGAMMVCKGGDVLQVGISLSRGKKSEAEIRALVEPLMKKALARI
jgi:hypothetical protein